MKKRRQNFFVLSCLLIFCCATPEINAQSRIEHIVPKKSVRIEHFYREDGLSNNDVEIILQDHLGFIWIGTERGLNRYDGYQFKTYLHQADQANSLRDNHVYSLYEDSSGNLWVGTQRALHRLKREDHSFTIYSHKRDNAQSLLRGPVYTIQEDSQRRLWVGTRFGIGWLDPETGVFTRHSFLPENFQGRNPPEVRAVHVDPNGKIWIGVFARRNQLSYGGIYRLDPQRNQWTHFPIQPGDPQSTNSGQINSLYEDSHKNLWIAYHQGGISRFDPKTETFSHYLPPAHTTLDDWDPANTQYLHDLNTSTLVEHPSGEIWIGLEDNGLDRFNIDSGTFTNYTFNPDNPYDLTHISRIQVDAQTLPLWSTARAST